MAASGSERQRLKAAVPQLKSIYSVLCTHTSGACARLTLGSAFNPLLSHTYTRTHAAVHGHCYYLEDGVEERNTFERNLAAHIHPINVAGSGGGQQGTDRWAAPDFFDPSDAGAGVGRASCFRSGIAL